MPMSPSSKYFGSSAGSILPAFSISADRGRTSSSAKAATASRNIISSSERRVSADGEAVASAGMSMDSLALYQIRGRLAADRTIGSPSLHPHAVLNSGMLLSGPFTLQLDGGCGSAVSYTH